MTILRRKRMRSIKSIPILALAGIAMVALAAPATASATFKWTYNGLPLQESANITLTGGNISMFVFGPGGEVECPTSGKATLGADSGAGTITSYDAAVSGCVTRGTGGVGNCEVTSTSSKPSSFQLLDADTVSVDGFSFTLNFKPKPSKECGWTKVEIYDGEHAAVKGELGMPSGFLKSLDLTGVFDYVIYYGGVPVYKTYGSFSANPLTITPAEKYVVQNW
jgi:hypothetical protein